MFPLKLLSRAFFLAPLLPCCVFLIGGFEDGVVYGLVGAVVHALFLFVYCVIACYFMMMIFALPFYLLGWAFLRVNLVACFIFGAIIGGAFFLIPFALQYYGRLPMYDSESLGGTALVINRHFTHAGVMNRLLGSFQGAVFGAAVALAFWLFGIRGNPHAQSRRNATKT